MKLRLSYILLSFEIVLISLKLILISIFNIAMHAYVREWAHFVQEDNIWDLKMGGFGRGIKMP